MKLHTGNRKGQTAIMFTLAIVPLFGMVGLVVDIGWAHFRSQAAQTAAGLGMGYARAATPGTDPRFVAMVRSLVRERIADQPRERLGTLPVWDVCPAGCCQSPQRKQRAA